MTKFKKLLTTRFKKLIALALVCVMVAAVAYIDPVPADAALGTVEMTAGWANDGLVLGYDSYYFDATGISYTDGFQSLADLESRGVDKVRSPFASFSVEAPQDGTYTIQPKYTLDGPDASTYKMTVVVNKGGEGNVYQHTPDTTLDVALTAGRNVIYLVPVVSDNASSVDLANLESVDIQGLVLDSSLTKINLGLTGYVPGLASFIGGWGSMSNDSIGGCNTTSDAITALNLDSSSLEDIINAGAAYFSYTVMAPEKGYYDISLQFNVDSAVPEGSYIGYAVNGELGKLPLDNYRSGSAMRFLNATTYLEEGANTITFTQNLKSGDDTAIYWTDFLGLYVTGGLTKAAHQADPLGKAMSRMEAEEHIDMSSYTSVDGFGYSSGNRYVTFSSSFDWGFLQTKEELATTFNMGYVPSTTYIVSAPADGTYTIQPYVLSSKNHTVTVRINDGDVYTTESDGAFYQKALDVKLKAGRNVISVITWLSTETDYIYETDGWYNPDYLAIDTRLEGVTRADTSVNAGDVAEYFGYCSKSDTAVKNSNHWNMMRAMLSVADVTKENLQKTVNYSFTVTAPEAGYYPIIESASCKGNFKYFGLLVDDTIYTGKKTNDGDIYFCVYLEKGDNTLAFTGEMPRDQEHIDSLVGSNNFWTFMSNDSNGYSWTDFNSVKLGGGLVESTNTLSPYHAYSDQIQAESANVILNGLTVNGDIAGNGYYGDTETVDELLDGLDKKLNPYTAVVVDAPEDGNYAFKATMAISINGIDATYRGIAGCPQVTFMVNGDTVVQSRYSGGSGEISETEALLPLKAGRNVIYVMPVTGEVIDFTTSSAGGSNAAGSVWANVDWVAIDTKLTLVAPNKVNKNAADAEYINYYTKSGGSLNSGHYGYIAENGVAIATLTRRTMAHVPYLSYTVNAPVTGYYDITAHTTHSSAYNTYGYMVDGITYGRKATSGLANFSVHLTAGEHVLVFTTVLPETATSSLNELWTDFSSIDFNGGLTVSSVQQNPSVQLSDPFEAEDALVSGYTVQEHADCSNGLYLGQAMPDKVNYADLESGSVTPQYDSHSYVAYAVYAPTEDIYDLGVVYRMGNTNSDAAAYETYKAANGAAFATVLVNGTPYKAEFPEDANMGDLVTSTVTVDMEAGLNLIQCMDVTGEIAEALDGAYIDYDCLKVQAELTAADVNVIAVKSDATFNTAKDSDDSVRSIGAADLIRAKKVADNKGTTAYSWLIDFDDNDTNDNADVEILKKILVDLELHKTLKIFDELGDVSAYSTVALYSGSSYAPTGYSTSQTSAIVNEVASDKETDAVITVNKNTKYQTMTGFGASITDTSAYNMYQLSEDTRNAAMESLFGQSGLRLTWLRQPLGTSDFAAEENGGYYTYCDTRGSSWNRLSNFSIARDEAQIIPLIKQAQGLVQGDGRTLRVFGTPWTAPRWMKEDTSSWFYYESNGDLNHLQETYYDEYAEYLVKAIEAYEGHNINIEAITLQNEPDGRSNIPSMFFNAKNINNFASTMATELSSSSVSDTKVFAYDFNWYSDEILGSSAVERVESFMDNSLYSGVAFHVYNGDASVMGSIYNKGNTVYVTEAAGNTGDENFFSQVQKAADSLNNGASTYIMWNIMLDENRGPLVGGTEINPIGIGLLQRNSSDETYTMTSDYYMMAHFSKFILPGAQVVNTTTSDDGIDVVAAVNTDGTTAIVLCNKNNTIKTARVDIGGTSYECKIQARSAMTLTVK